MKSFFRLFFISIFILGVSGYAQDKILSKVSSLSVKKNIASPANTYTLKSILPNSGATSGNSRAPQGAQRYVRTGYIISAAELAAAGVPKGATFYSWGFSYSTAQNVATTGALKLYLQNTTDAAWSKSTTWSNGSTGTIDSMTLVHDGNVTIPATTGAWDFTLSNGTAFTYNGGALYVAFDYQNATGTIATTANVANCNANAVGGSNGLRNAFSTTAIPTAIANTSAYRPETRAGFKTGVNNDAAVTLVYSYGKLPLVWGAASPIQACVQNVGDQDLTNVVVTLKVTGANTFTNTKTVASLTHDAAASLVTFDAFTPTATGANTVTVSVASDGNNANNSVSTLLTTTNNTFGYGDTSAAISGIGYGTTSGAILARYFVSGSANVSSVTLPLFNYTANTGKTLYGIVTDSTGKILDTSAAYTTKASDLGQAITLTFPKTPTVTNKSIYIGIAQVASTTAWYPVGYQAEDPSRDNAYFGCDLDGSNFGEISDYGRFMIEANLAKATTIPVELSSFTSSAKDGVVTLKWSTATETNNSGFQVERKIASAATWSNIGFVKGNSTTTAINSYSFKDDVSKLGVASYNYRLKQIDFDGSAKYYNLTEAVQVSGPQKFDLSQNYPNPFNPSTTISYSVAVDGKVKIEVYDVLGKLVKTLVNENKAAGSYSVSFNASELSSGVYIYKLSAGNVLMTKKMSLLK
jgi:hypothetical protein